MDQAEVDKFIMSGQSALTILAQAQEALERYAASFEQRGGSEVYGDDATQIVYLSNDLVTWMTPERAATIARLRIDV
jgi:hypothetical protein